MRLAVIPARGGSKRIPRKNVKPFCGKPMIVWPIEAALRSRCFDHVMVTTDDPEIAHIAQQHGAEVPFMRPQNLSDDHTGTLPVVAHAVRWYEQNLTRPTQICCIYATAAFVRPADLQQGLDILAQGDCEYAISVTDFAFPIQRALRITTGGRIEMFDPSKAGTRSQDLESAWHDAGQFYWGHADAWLANRPILSPITAPIVLPRHRVQDIDTQEDWVRAQWMFKALLHDDTPD